MQLTVKASFASLATLLTAIDNGVRCTKHIIGHCCKVSDEAAFCLIQRPYISKTLLTRRISPGDHHNKMLRPGLCVVHASPQYL